MELNLPLILAWLCLIHLNFFAIVLFLKNNNKLANRMLGIFMILMSLIHLSHFPILYKKEVFDYHFMPILFLSIFFQAPVYLQYTSHLSGIEINWRKHFVWHLLPFIVPIIYLISIFLKSKEDIIQYYESSFKVQPLDANIVIAVASLQYGFYMIWSLRIINKYQKNILYKKGYSNLVWLKMLTIFMLLLAFVITPILIALIASDIAPLYIYMPIISILMYLILFIRSINFPSTELEKSITRAEEREKISRDMHDDIGSGLSKIAIMSELLKSKNTNNIDLNKGIGKISETANELVDSMGQIIWAMNPQNDTLENLMAYIREFSLDFYDSSSVNCMVNFPSSINNIILTQEQRRNVFLVVKETLNNSLKYAQAQNVNITLICKLNHCVIQITDDGKGFNMINTHRFGNGLHNMKKRMDDIGGALLIESKEGYGCKTLIKLNH